MTNHVALAGEIIGSTKQGEFTQLEVYISGPPSSGPFTVLLGPELPSPPEGAQVTLSTDWG